MIKISALLLSFLLAAAPAAAQGTRIGAAAAVAGVVKAVAPGAVGRIVDSGKPLFLNDHVTTDGKGRLQVLLLDETVFTIGPNSDMVLDEFVYDPATSAGKVTAKVTKGVFRFVTGKVARKTPSNMQVNLPVGTIGIRGTIAIGEVDGKDATVILMGPGADSNTGDGPGSVEVDVPGGGDPVVLDQPGFGTKIADGKDPSSPTNMTAEAEKLSASLEPKPSEAKDDSAHGEETASEQSGDDTAAGDILAKQTAETDQSQEENDTTSTYASQDGAEAILDGLSTWDQVRTIESGQATYTTSSGQYSCVGGSCSTNTTGPMSFSLDVDFGQRQIMSGNITLNNSTGGSGSFSTTSTSINAISFANLAGDAKLTLGSAVSSGFSASQASFENAGGVVAGEATIDVNYSGFSGETVTGSMTATKGPFTGF